jgi:hypothetical protein
LRTRHWETRSRRDAARVNERALRQARTSRYIDLVPDGEPITEAMLMRVAERFSVLGQVVYLRLVEQLADGSATPQDLADRLGRRRFGIMRPRARNARASAPAPAGPLAFDVHDGAVGLRDQSEQVAAHAAVCG